MPLCINVINLTVGLLYGRVTDYRQLL